MFEGLGLGQARCRFFFEFFFAHPNFRCNFGRRKRRKKNFSKKIKFQGGEPHFSEQRIFHYRPIFPISVTLTEVPDRFIFRNNNIYIFCIFFGPKNDENNLRTICEISWSTSPTLVDIAHRNLNVSLSLSKFCAIKIFSFIT